MLTRTITSAALVILLSAGAGVAFAQQAPVEAPPPQQQRTYRGLFRGGEEAPGLALILSGAGGYDTNALAGQQGGGGSELQQGQLAGSFTEGNGTLSYLRFSNGTELSVLGAGSVRYYPHDLAPTTHSVSAAAAFGFGLGQRWRINVRQAGSHSSFNQLVAVPRGPLPAEFVVPLEAPTPDTSVMGRDAVSFDSGADATQTLSPRNSIVYHLTYRSTELGFDRQRLTMYGGGVRFNRRASRYASLRVGYGYQQADYGDPHPLTELHNLDTGFDYARPLSFSRRTTVGVSTGMEAFERQDVLFYRAQITAHLVHEIGRTWNIRGMYDRGAQFVELLGEPVYADTFSAHAGGFLVGRRLEMSVDGYYSNGQLTYTFNQNAMVTYTGSASLEWGLSPNWSIHTSYGYYSYRFGQDVTLPTGLLPETKRHSVRVGVSYWIPLMTARGNGNGAR